MTQAFATEENCRKAFSRILMTLSFKKIKELVFEEMTDLLAEASWMSA